jgi:hypothetical protein
VPTLQVKTRREIPLYAGADRSRRANGKKKSACFARNDRWDNREKVGENCGVWAFLGLGWSR